MYQVYILYSQKFGKTYCGMTSNLVERFRSHNELGRKEWTKNFRPWIILYTEGFELKSAALLREKFLKTGAGRQFITGLLEERGKGPYPPEA